MVGVVVTHGPVTASEAPERRLIAVAHADVVGYSRLIGLDDADTVDRLHRLRLELVDPEITRHGGRLVNTAGDALLVAFTSATAALRWAVDVQSRVPDFDGGLTEDRRIRFRIGVNIGDVLTDGEDIHGNGVNVAARLQAVCPPGGVCVSAAIREHVGGRLGLAFVPLGPLELKNIANPVEAFVLQPETAIAPPQPKRRLLALAAAAVFVLAGLTAGGWWVTRPPTPEPLPPRPLAAAVETQPTATTTSEPARPPSAVAASPAGPPPLSIAVLPFTNLSGDPEQAYLADGIAEDLTTDLSHLAGSFVIARESAFSFRGKQVDIRDIGRLLGVRYLVEGSVRKINASVRINLQLIAAETGGHVWAERFDKAITDLGEGQDDIVARIASILGVQLVNLESARRARAQSGNPAAVDFVLRARAILHEIRDEDRTYIATGLFLQALHADPNSVPAMTGVASMFAGRFNNFTTTKRATELVAKAEERAPGAPDVLVAKFLLLQREQHNEEALALYRHLLEVNPGATGSIVEIGLCRCWASEEEAIPLLRKTIQLNPRTPNVRSVHYELGRSLLLADRNAEARDALQLMLTNLPPADDEPASAHENLERWQGSVQLLLAIADIRLGQSDEARRAIAAALNLDSMRDYSVRSYLRSNRDYRDAAAIAQERRLLDDLRRAGLRDHLDEDLDSAVASTAALRDFSRLDTPTPMSIPGGKTVKTSEVVDMLANRKPVIITTSNSVPTMPGAIFVDIPATGNLNDAWQSNLRRLLTEMTAGDPARPVLVFGWNVNRWQARNLALRIIALGYTDVSWYRGGWEAWEASGQPRGPLAGRRNL